MNKVILVTITGLMVSGCVGTGGYSLSNNDDEYFPIEHTFKAIYLDNDERVEKAVIDSNEEETIVKIIEKGQTLFRDKPVYASDRIITSYLNGNEYYRDLSTHFYTLNPLQFVGFTGSEGDMYSISHQFKNLPKKAKIGDSERYITETVYYDKDFKDKKYSYDQAWSLTAASADTAWLCNESFDKTPQGFIKEEVSFIECYEIDKDGNLLRYKDDYINVPIYNNVSD